MNNVVPIDSTTCMGLEKSEFRETYFSMKTNATEADFEREWVQFCEEKASAIRHLKGERQA